MTMKTEAQREAQRRYQKTTKGKETKRKSKAKTKKVKSSKSYSFHFPIGITLNDKY